MKRSLLITAATLVLTGTQGLSQGLPAHEFTPEGHAFQRGELIVQFSKNVNDGQIEEAFRQGKLNLIRHIRTAAMEHEGSLGLTHVITTWPAPVAARLIGLLPGVDFAEPNWVAEPDFAADDPFYLSGALWNMYGVDQAIVAGPDGTTNPFGSQAEQAWAAGFIGSSEVYIGNIDSGVDFGHPDLAQNIWTNPGEIPGNGIDDDGNGYIDDLHGWNAMHDNGTTFDLNDIPNEVHGTATAGVAGAVGGNGIGIAGASWNVKIITGKFLPRGSYVDAIEAVDYMTNLRVRKGVNIVALNNSWSGTAYSQALQDAYTRAAKAGILSTCSAGNYSADNDVSPRYPAGLNTTAGAGFDAIIAVAATDRDGNLATFSNFGQNSVDLGAPGADITTTVPGGYSGGKNGTSYAAPLVAGAIALYASSHPEATPEHIRQDLSIYGLRPTPSLQFKTATAGRLDVLGFVSTPSLGATPPEAPAAPVPSVVSGNRVNLAWTDRSDNELGFALERSLDGTAYNLVDTVGANITAYSDRTVRPATTYFYRLRAYRPGAASDYVYAASAVTTPSVQLPAAPANLGAAVRSPGKGGGILLTWSDRSNNEDGFQIERKTGANGSWSVLATVGVNSTQFADLSVVAKTSYSYRLRAFNAAGTSAYSNTATATMK
jgi:hypothetical protein